LLPVHHLSLADNIVVLGADGKVAEQGTYEYLRSQGGFVSNILLHPELLQSKANIAADEAVETLKRSQAPTQVAAKEPSANDVADLTRQIGDTAVYMYYLRSIGWKLALGNISSSCLFAVSLRFPGKWNPNRRLCDIADSLALWLNFYVNGTVTGLPLFASMFAVSAVVALVSAYVVLS
jgi:hypothetical protein